jgi:hypothetical protein
VTFPAEETAKPKLARPPLDRETLPILALERGFAHLRAERTIAPAKRKLREISDL